MTGADEGALPKESHEEELPEDMRALFASTSLPDEALAEIGRAVAQFAILEHNLFRVVQGLLGGRGNKEAERVVRVLTSELSFGRLLDLSASLIRELHGDTVAEDYKAVLKAIEMAEVERNTLTHCLWAMSMPLGENKPFVRTKYTAKRRKGLQFRKDKLDINDLRRNATKIAAATFDLRSFAASRLGLFTDY